MKKIEKGFGVIQILLIIAVIATLGIVGVFVWHKNSLDNAKTTIPLASHKDRTDALSARDDADFYLSTIKTCDLYSASDYSLEHRNITNSDIEKCKTYCKPGISYEFVNQKMIVTGQDQSGSNDVNKTDEIDYIVRCNSPKQAFAVDLNLIYSSSSHRWEVINPLADPSNINSPRNWLTTEF